MDECARALAAAQEGAGAPIARSLRASKRAWYGMEEKNELAVPVPAPCQSCATSPREVPASHRRRHPQQRGLWHLKLHLAALRSTVASPEWCVAVNRTAVPAPGAPGRLSLLSLDGVPANHFWGDV